jgi:hypothetical protein
MLLWNLHATCIHSQKRIFPCAKKKGHVLINLSRWEFATSKVYCWNARLAWLDSSSSRMYLGDDQGSQICSARTKTCTQCSSTRPIQPMFWCHLGTVISAYRMVVLPVCYSAVSHYLVPPNHSAKLFGMDQLPDFCFSLVENTTYAFDFGRS